MSARGARSRKVAQKEVEKIEKKAEKKIGKSKAIDAYHVTPDAFADWRVTPGLNHPKNDMNRTLTMSSQTTTHSNSTSDSGKRPQLGTMYSSEARAPNSSAGGSTTVSDTSSKEKTKYQHKGKETKAPRGRNGGVPVKGATAPSPMPVFRAASTVPSLAPSQKTWANFKVWEGGKEGMRPYGGFEAVSYLYLTTLVPRTDTVTRTMICTTEVS